jgi:hypothetical protein
VPSIARAATSTIVTAAALLTSLPVAAAAESRETVARLPGPSAVREHAGWVAVSEYDPSRRRYALVAFDPQGRRHVVPAGSGRRPFDADVGPDGHGRPTLVFSAAPAAATSSPCRSAAATGRVPCAGRTRRSPRRCRHSGEGVSRSRAAGAC